MLYGNGKRKNGGAARGLEYLQSNPKYVTYNDLGQMVTNNANLVNDDGTAHVAYQGAPGTYIYSLIEKQKKGFPLTEDEQRTLSEFWAQNPTAGLATIDQLGGNHNGGIKTRQGSQDKSTTDASSYKRATRDQGGKTTYVWS